MNVDLYGIIRMILICSLIKKKALRLKVQTTFTQASVYKLEIDESFVKMIENDYIVVEVQIFLLYFNNYNVHMFKLQIEVNVTYTTLIIISLNHNV